MGCGPATDDELLVLAAASLGEPFSAIAGDYTRESGVAVRCSFAGSQVLAAQLEAGVEADLVAVADPEIMERLADSGRVGPALPFASNALVWVSRRDADASLARLGRAPLRVVLAAHEVPAGRYAHEALAGLGLLEAARAGLVSEELDVKGVLAKLQLGGADAGITYATEIPADARDLVVEALPRPRAVYWIAASVDGADAESRRFVEFVRGPRGRARLAEHGFGPP